MIPANTLTLTEAIAANAASHPADVVMTFLVAGQAADALTYGRLHTEAQKIAGRLEKAGIGPGDVLVLAGHHNAALIAAFLATLYAGATPTIAPYPTAFTRTALHDRRLLELVSISQARAVLALPDIQARLAETLSNSGCITLDLSAF
jgi:acyl-CoA synthetase (AMP-forming)/AMP-acid ligase II